MKSTFLSNYTRDFFSIHINQTTYATKIDLQVLPTLINTASLPNTRKILSVKLPSIHTSTCFNDKKLPFFKEVRRTEIGHLFEHILLENIYSCKIAQGHQRVCVNGETSWNWNNHPKGFFTIIVNIGSEEKNIFYEALTPSIELLQYIFASHIKGAQEQHLWNQPIPNDVC